MKTIVFLLFFVVSTGFASHVNANQKVYDGIHQKYLSRVEKKLYFQELTKKQLKLEGLLDENGSLNMDKVIRVDVSASTEISLPLSTYSAVTNQHASLDAVTPMGWANCEIISSAPQKSWHGASIFVDAEGSCRVIPALGHPVPTSVDWRLNMLLNRVPTNVDPDMKIIHKQGLDVDFNIYETRVETSCVNGQYLHTAFMVVTVPTNFCFITSWGVTSFVVLALDYSGGRVASCAR